MTTLSTGRRIVCALLVVAVAGLALREWHLLPGGQTVVHFLDVGQGDSALVSTRGGRTILIDGGPDWSALERLGEEMPFFDRSIDALILTHADRDHVTALPEVLERYRVGTLFLSENGPTSPMLDHAIVAAVARGTRLQRIHASEALDLGDGVAMDVLWPPQALPPRFLTKRNDASLVLRLRTSGSQSVLFTGDIEALTEQTLVRAGADLHATILKAPHHGSKTSSSTGFLLAVGATTVVISDAKNNSYGHPHAEVLRRYAALGMNVRRTDTEGTITLSLADEAAPHRR